MVIFWIYARERRTRITNKREEKRKEKLHSTTGTLVISNLETEL